MAVYRLDQGSGTIVSDASPLPVTNVDGQASLEDLVTAFATANAHLADIEAASEDTGAVPVESGVRVVALTPSIEATALDAGDVVFATEILAAVVRTDDAYGLLQSIAVIDEADQKAQLTFHFFSANVALGTEDAGPSISDGDAASWLGSASVAAADYIDLGGVSVVQVRNIGLPIKPVTSSDDIYVAATTTGTPTYGSATALKLRFGFLI